MNDDLCGKAEQREQVQELYTALALHPERDFGWGKGRENARSLGYRDQWLDRLSDDVWESAAAVGNPFSLGPIQWGETVLDLGCGAGADVCVAAILVGEQGQVVGIDITSAMVEKARANVQKAGFTNVHIHQADISEIHLEDSSVDVVISNGSLNLSSAKSCVLKEAFRALKPAGRLHIADMIRSGENQSCDASTDDSWADCVAGTLTPERLVEMIKEAGFVNVRMVETTKYRTSRCTVGALFYAEKPG
ncbi:methyltransferase domain-containing protein [Stieleria magnilauensis]|uniref:methyltransferase domain-containing protein n=1 Tax=Stieleria magnilauensis TaxID=2527963 RepID=UPI003AF9836C